MRRLFESRQPSEYEPDKQEERNEEPDQRPDARIQTGNLLVEQSRAAGVSLCEECIVLYGESDTSV